MDLSDFPNPCLARDGWIDLNGQWDFCFDDNDDGLNRRLYEAKELPGRINVPFAYQTEASGIGDRTRHPVMWYHKRLELDDIGADEELYLNFAGVDYQAMIWLNGIQVGQHIGGYTSFRFPVGYAVRKGWNDIVLRVVDDEDTAQLRGKQDWPEAPKSCWYIPSSGIWKGVWIERTGRINISNCLITPDLDNHRAKLQLIYSSKGSSDCLIHIVVYYGENSVVDLWMNAMAFRQDITIDVVPPNSVDNVHVWSPDNPSLYYVKLELVHKTNRKLLDSVMSYFGMRKVCIHNGDILLNNRPLYQRLVLDQGYWPYSGLTPPDEEAYVRDIRLIKAMGFNGVRKHQKIEDQRFYYQASLMGLLVWAELPSAYSFSPDEMGNAYRDLVECIGQLYNHPSIITWVPLNESWGVRDIFTDKQQQCFADSLYYLLKAYDSNRLISTNDGWEQPISDICAIHDYSIVDEKSFDRHWSSIESITGSAVQSREVYAQGYAYSGQPILLTEFGGIAFASDTRKGAWGYNAPVSDEDEFIKRLNAIMAAIHGSRLIKGFCYTQLTDVYQEVNGLLSFDRIPKCDLSVYERIFGY